MNPNDPDVIALTKAIFQHESGMDYTAVGDAGTSHGAGQWQPATWKAQAKDVLGDENAQMTPENQKAVAQVSIAKDKADGLNPAQIAAKWNSGSPTGWENKIGTTTINGQQIKYNVPAYVKSVTDLYQQYKGQSGAPSPTSLIQGQNQPTQPNGVNNLLQQPDDSSNLDAQIQALTTKSTQENQKPGFLQGLQEDLNGTNPESIGTQLGNTAKGVGNFLFPSVGDVYHDIKGDSTKTGLQQLGDAGSTALSAATLIPGVGEGVLGAKAALMGGKAVEGATAAADLTGAAGKGFVSDIGKTQPWDIAKNAAPVAAKATPTIASTIAKNGALGAAYGATGALGSGETDPTKIAEGAGIGAATGGVLGGAAAGLSKAAEVLPQRLVQGVIKNSNPDVAKYALTKQMGSPAKMLADSDSSLKTIGSQLGAALTHSSVADVVVPSNQIVPKIMEAFPNAELSPEKLEQEIGKVAPLQKRLITKLFSGEGLTIDELHTLNSAIGQNTYKMAFDDPQVKAGKAIGNAFYQASKQIITTAAPDTTPLFDQYSKEIQLNTALDKLVKRGSKAQALTLKDIIALVGGFSALGPIGSAGAFAAERAATSPTVNLQAAGLLNKAAGSGLSKLAAPATIAGTGLLRQAVQGTN